MTTSAELPVVEGAGLGEQPEVGGVGAQGSAWRIGETRRHEVQIYQLRAVLRGISPLIWRRVLVRGSERESIARQACTNVSWTTSSAMAPSRASHRAKRNTSGRYGATEAFQRAVLRWRAYPHQMLRRHSQLLAYARN